MRKCRSCGYLLLGEGETCGRCGAPLAAVTVGGAAVPAAAAAAAPADPPVPARAVASIPGLAPQPAPAPPPPTGAPLPAQPLPALRESWQPIAMPQSTTKEPRSKQIGLTILAIVIALVVGSAVMHLRSNPVPKGTSAFVAGNGVVYNSPDGVYQAQFPRAAQFEQQAATNGTLDRAYDHTDDYEIIAVSTIAPAAIPPERVSDLLQTGLQAEMTNLDAKLSSSQPLQFSNLPAIEGRFKGKDGYQGRILAVVSGANVFEVVVHAKSGTDRLFRAFESSLILR